MWKIIFTIGVVATGFHPIAISAGEWSGQVAMESRVFPQSPLSREQGYSNLSLRLETEFYHDWIERNERFVFVPFLRLDQHDSKRSHFDIRELYWQKVGESWELTFGLRKVFWGVTESRHLVDVINQTDLVENPDGEDKLGQPMVTISWIKNWGTLDVFILPFFRQRTFPDYSARFRTPLPVYEDLAVVESQRFDWAIRWSHTLGVFDIGLAHFSGRSRDPRWGSAINASSQIAFVPYYDMMHQTSLDLQATTGGWLWKLEAITSARQNLRHFAFTGGFEYTFVGAFDTGYDIGVLTEYLFDDRDYNVTPFQNDAFFGSRIALNDVQSTEILAGAIVDAESGATTVFLEAGRRIGQSWRMDLEMRSFVSVPQDDLLYGVRKDHSMQMTLSRHF